MKICNQWNQMITIEMLLHNHQQTEKYVCVQINYVFNIKD